MKLCSLAFLSNVLTLHNVELMLISVTSINRSADLK